MGKAGRLACIFVPMALSIASLICIILVAAGGTNKGSSILNNQYFFKANTTGFDKSAVGTDVIPGTKVDSDVLNQFLKSGNGSTKDIKQIYTVSLWNYCAGSTDDKGNYKVDECSSSQRAYWFNPVQVWGLQDTPLANSFPKELADGLKTYHKVSTWMFWAYVVAFASTVVEIIVGIFAICSRWGSCVTSIVSGVSSAFTFAASVTSTALFSMLAGSFNSYLKGFHILGSLGRNMMITTWLATAFSLGAGLFWLVSMCCVSGHSKDKSDKKSRGFGRSHTYERVSSPYHGGSGNYAAQPSAPAHQSSTPQMGHQPGYEPFRYGQA